MEIVSQKALQARCCEIEYRADDDDDDDGNDKVKENGDGAQELRHGNL
jgi:hypothetical protein